MKWLLLLLATAGVAHADIGLPTQGPCDDVDACEQACYKKGQIPACEWGGTLAVQSPFDDEMKARGLKLFDRACSKIILDCWFAAHYTDDIAKGRRYLDQACLGRHVPSCVMLAKTLDNTGDDKSQKAAATIYKKVINMLEPRCNAKEVYACSQLSVVYERMANQCRKRACQAETGQPCSE